MILLLGKGGGGGGGGVVVVLHGYQAMCLQTMYIFTCISTSITNANSSTYYSIRCMQYKMRDTQYHWLI